MVAAKDDAWVCVGLSAYSTLSPTLDETAVPSRVRPRVVPPTGAPGVLRDGHLLFRGPVVGSPFLLEHRSRVRESQDLRAVSLLKVDVHLKSAVVAVTGIGRPTLVWVLLVAVDTQPVTDVADRQKLGLQLGDLGFYAPQLFALHSELGACLGTNPLRAGQLRFPTRDLHLAQM